MLSKDSTVAAIRNQLSTDVSGETVILTLTSGIYYGLKNVGADIWNLLQEPRTVDDIKAALLAKYEVEPEQCERDLLGLLQELQAEQLIEIKNETIK